MVKCIICGNVTADPVLNEREYTDPTTGEIIKTKVCNFSVAANEGYGDRRTTTYFRVAAWRGYAESCAKYLSKGRAVLVTGPVKMNNYVDKTGTIRSGMEIRADDIQFLGSSKSTMATPEPDAPEAPATEEPSDDDLPY